MTHVDIQYFCAPGNLSLRQGFDILKILFNQRLSQLFDTSWVYLFPNDDEGFILPNRHFLCVTFQSGVHCSTPAVMFDRTETLWASIQIQSRFVERSHPSQRASGESHECPAHDIS